MKKKSKKWYWIFGLIIIAAVVGVIVKKKKGQVVLEKVKKGNVIEAVYGIGTTTSRQTFDLKFGQITGLDEILVQEGDKVNKGQKLLRAEGRSFFSPISGVVSVVNFKSGETVGSNQTVVRITDPNDLYLVVNLEQESATKVQNGQKVRISYESLREEKFEGTVRSIFSNGSEFKVNVDIEKLSEKILPGMAADVAIVLGVKENVLLVPVAALQGKKIKVAQQGNLPKEIEVIPGLVDGEMVEIQSTDIKEDDSVVVEGKKK